MSACDFSKRQFFLRNVLESPVLSHPSDSILAPGSEDSASVSDAKSRATAPRTRKQGLIHKDSGLSDMPSTKGKPTDPELRERLKEGTGVIYTCIAWCEWFC
ncbi:hypothetical protein CC78DRAFT_530085 [Lojkania enalia]|uniref:Uncharacterized protein n=1 Tax=Lojkania enalia TaxID=147567 RepID=A0A9P4KGB6_9PLEO|nr:hypothetical protein CC78DRAFT_530085 [Didymosphaeria enalia]